MPDSRHGARLLAGCRNCLRHLNLLYYDASDREVGRMGRPVKKLAKSSAQRGRVQKFARKLVKTA